MSSTSLPVQTPLNDAEHTKPPGIMSVSYTHLEQQRHHRHESGSRQLEDGVLRKQCQAHTPHHLETITQVGKRLDVGAAHQGFIGRRAAAQPFGIELAHVTLGQRAILA